MKYLNILFVVFTITFILREVVAYRGNLTFKYLLTPLLTGSVIAVAVLSIVITGPNHYNLMVLAALIFSLTADTLLMIEEVNLLKNGILFFIAAHLIYLFIFSEGYSFKMWNLAILLILPVINFFHFRMLKKNAGKLIVPLAVYILIIDAMGFFAITKLNNGFGVYEFSVAAGAVLFWISDFILSINAFVKKIPNSTVYTWLFYAPAQFLFAFSTLSYH